MTTLLWLRDDLRLTDHEALSASSDDARAHDGCVVALWIREQLPDSAEPGLGARPLGAASRWWTHRSLAELAPRLAELGIPLLFTRGDPREIVPRVAHALGASTVRWSRRYAPGARALDAMVKSAVLQSGIRAHSHPGALLVEPWLVSTASGGHYSVFTPFHRAAAAVPTGPLRAVPSLLPEPDAAIRDAIARLAADRVTCSLDELGLLDHSPPWWRDTVEQHWCPGELAALERLDRTDTWLGSYSRSRDLPADPESTSRLSPHLRSGEISPRTVLLTAQGRSLPSKDVTAWVRQLYWREFCWHLTYHVPDLRHRPLRPRFEDFPYQESPELLRAWQRGHTGIDLVDAGMLELWHTGWMHNRVRMVTASLLTKNMLQPWWLGEQWFWDTLVDADEANNPVQWQWVAGCGADAAPYFRVFNPDLQARRHDPDNRYIGRWLSLREPGGITPVVDLAESRRAALEAYQIIRD